MYYRKGGQGYHFSTSNFENTKIMKMQLAAPRSFAMCFAPSCFAALQPWHHGGSQPLQPPLSLASNPALAPTWPHNMAARCATQQANTLKMYMWSHFWWKKEPLFCPHMTSICHNTNIEIAGACVFTVYEAKREPIFRPHINSQYCHKVGNVSY